MIDELRNIHFTGLPDVRWDHVLSRNWFEVKCCPSTGSIWNKLKYYSHAFILRKSQTDYSLHSDTEVLMTQFHNIRMNSIKIFESVALLKKSDTITQHEAPILRFNALGTAVSLFFYFIPCWERTLNHTTLSASLKQSIIQTLISLYVLNKELKKKVNFNKYKLYIAYYDSLSEESFISELSRQNGLVTATLQHGQFVNTREWVLENSGVELKTSFSDYFLMWNKFTRDEALLAGMDERRMKVVGILGYVGSVYSACSVPNNGCFGVVIGHPMYERENLNLIAAANILAEKKQFHYYLKLHPNYSDAHFDTYIDKKWYKGNVKKFTPMMDYANSVDFSIVGSSSVFSELVYIKHKVVRYSALDIKDKYRDIKEGRIFHRPEEVTEAYGSDCDEDILFDYVCTIDHVTESYLNAINDMIVDCKKTIRYI